jgi:hypothetical protein
MHYQVTKWQRNLRCIRLRKKPRKELQSERHHLVKGKQEQEQRGGARGWGAGEMNGEKDRIFLGQWNDTVWSHYGGCPSWNCAPPQHPTPRMNSQLWALNDNVGSCTWWVLTIASRSCRGLGGICELWAFHSILMWIWTDLQNKIILRTSNRALTICAEKKETPSSLGKCKLRILRTDVTKQWQVIK